MNGYVWVAYTKKAPYLPYAIAETAGELARLTGRKESSIVTGWSKYRKGVLKRSAFHRVFVGGEV